MFLYLLNPQAKFLLYTKHVEGGLGGESGFNSCFEEDIKGIANVQHLFNQNLSKEMKVDYF